jgi:amino acid transporter
MLDIARLLLGRTLANREAEAKKLAVWDAIPAMGLDALSSSAYGPEAALAVLAPLGLAGLTIVGPLTLAIVILLALLFFSYRQTLAAYPRNGGAYPVVKANMGENASLVAAGALMLDYVLNAAVAIAAGVAALVSIVPGLIAYTLSLCLAALALIALANLRGTLEAGRLFAVPVYLFLGCFLLILSLGAFKVLTAAGHPAPTVPPHRLHAAGAADIWLLLRAFASGCTAMTGVEAVSNSMSAFRQPVLARARATLGIIVGALAVLLLGIAWLARAYQIGAMNETEPGYRSILAQLAAAVTGTGPFYYLAVASTLAVLALSANTSFTAFPRLCRMLAEDGFLPAPFAIVGRRLVNTVGIIYLVAAAGALLILFGGITDRLIPLFAIGAFLTFTLSQAAMIFHWRRAAAEGDNSARTRVRIAINAIGGLATAATLIVIVLAKFTEGAWISLLMIPAVFLLLRQVRRYYDRLYRRMQVRPAFRFEPEPPLLLVAIESWSEPARHALALAMRMSPDVIAVHLTSATAPEEDEAAGFLQSQWPAVEQAAVAAGQKPPRLCLIPAPHRRIDEPFLEFLAHLRPEKRPVAVLIPQLVLHHWWERILHARRAEQLRAELLRHGGNKVTVVDVPWHPEERPETGAPG